MHNNTLRTLVWSALKFGLDTAQMVVDGDIAPEDANLPDALAGLTADQMAELRVYADAFMGRQI